MFLLNNQMILENKGSSGLLDIVPFVPENLCPTYYYFGLGRYYRRWVKDKEDWKLGDLGERGKEVLEIQPEEFLIIQSYERFRCSKQTMAVFGQSSGLVRRGVSIRNSPFVDPNFPDDDEPGYLELGLKNEIPRIVRLKYKEIIGKICFFNVADTYPIGDVKGTMSERDFTRRGGKAKPTPLYDDDPRPGWKEVEEAGLPNREGKQESKH